MTLDSELKYINHSPDVLIIGGGAAGVAAAVSASQAGASVTLIEKNGFLGGKATAAFVGTVCGLFYSSANQSHEFVTHGFPKEFGEKLMQMSDTKPQFQNKRLHFFPYKREAFIALCNEFTSQNKVSVLLHSYVDEVKVQNNLINEVGIKIYNKPEILFPKAVIDCSGEAVASLLTDSEFLSSDQYQAAAQVFELAGLPESQNGDVSLNMLRAIKKAIDNNLLPKEYERISVVPGTVKNGKALFKLGIPLKVEYSIQRIAEIELFAKKAVSSIVEYLKTNNEFFKNTYLELIAPEAGIRTGPRHIGKYILNEDDVLTCARFDDSIARGTWPIEFWEPGKNVSMTYFEDHDYYEISSGCLASKEINNLFFGGRNISATDQAIASARVIGTCLQTGFAAGKLAGGFINKTNHGSIISEIQQALFKTGSK